MRSKTRHDFIRTCRLLGSIMIAPTPIGILRWLTVMPALTRSCATTDAAGRVRIECVFDAITFHGSGIG